MTIKLTKNALRAEQTKLNQLERYLPTLQLKKSMLQIEVYQSRLELKETQSNYDKLLEAIKHQTALLSYPLPIPLSELVQVDSVEKRMENIAGVDVPYFDSMSFKPISYSLVHTPIFLDSLLATFKGVIEAQVRIDIAKEKNKALEKELREVSIRVNLFEKVLIPRAKENIKVIRVFLGDQDLAAVSRAKVAKMKIEKNKELMHS